MISDGVIPKEMGLIQKDIILAGSKMLPKIETEMKSSVNLRRIAPKIVKNWPSSRSRKILIQLIKDEDSYVRSEAATYFSEVGGKEVVPYLIDAAKDLDANVRHNALNSLSSLQAIESFDVAVASLEDEEYYVRWSAIGLIAEIGIPRGIDILREVLSNESDEKVKMAAERAIRVLEAKKEFYWTEY